MDEIRMKCHHCQGFTWWDWDDYYHAYRCCGCQQPTRTDRAGKRAVLIRVDGREEEHFV